MDALVELRLKFGRDLFLDSLTGRFRSLLDGVLALCVRSDTHRCFGVTQRRLQTLFELGFQFLAGFADNTFESSGQRGRQRLENTVYCFRSKLHRKLPYLHGNPDYTVWTDATSPPI